MADELRADAILVFTIHGTMARYTAWMRPRYSPIYAICDTQEVADSLTLNRAVKPMVIPFDHSNREKTIERTLEILKTQGVLQKGNTTVVISSIAAGEQMVNAVQMRVVN